MKDRTKTNNAADGALAPNDQQHLQAAEGWLHLGDHVSAFNELEGIAPASRAHPSVLRARYEIYVRAGKWESAFQLAEGMTRLEKLEDSPEPFILRSRAARQMKDGGLLMAFDLLNDVAPNFRDAPEVPFHLACFAFQLGRTDEARQLLQRALAAADLIGTRDEWKRRARAESDLAGLR
jgi:uncharacterized protein HemY